jgi:hypothetical protein
MCAVLSFFLITKSSFIFKVLMAESMKMAAFWVVAPCRLVEVYFRYACCLIIRVIRCLHHHPDDGGSKYL